MHGSAIGGMPVPERRIVRFARQCLQADAALLASVGAHQRILVVDGDGATFGVEVGATFPASDTICPLMIAGRVPRVIGDTGTLPALRDKPIVREAGVAAYVGVPVSDAAGRVAATLCVVSRTPRPAWRAADARLLAALAARVAPPVVPGGLSRAAGLQPDAFEHADAEVRSRVRLALEVASRLGAPARDLVAIADEAARDANADPHAGEPERPLGERIAAAAGSYVSMTSLRSGMSGPDARGALLAGAGSRFCAIAVTALLSVLAAEMAPDGAWIQRGSA